MIEKGFANVTAHRWRDIPLQVMQAEVAVRRAWGQNQGAMADAWKIAVPGSATKSGNGNSAYAPIDVQKYVGGEYGDLFRLGSDISGLDIGNLDESEVGR